MAAVQYAVAGVLAKVAIACGATAYVVSPEHLGRTGGRETTGLGGSRAAAVSTPGIAGGMGKAPAREGPLPQNLWVLAAAVASVPAAHSSQVRSAIGEWGRLVRPCKTYTVR